MNEHRRTLCNRFLVDVFHQIWSTEAERLSERFQDLSLRELHLIDTVCRAVEEGRDNRATAIAAIQKVTAGTLTTAVTLLEKKGYLLRQRDPSDRRAVRILPTDKGRQADRYHAQFHTDMVDQVLDHLTDQEADSLIAALEQLTAFFRPAQMRPALQKENVL